jgi:hypothetical protein
MKNPADKPPKPEVTLDGILYPLIWNKGAAYLADELGLFTADDGVGIAQGAKYIWCMLPESARQSYPTPKAVAAVLPPIEAAWAAINAAFTAAGEEMDPKKLFGSMNGPSPSSS